MPDKLKVPDEAGDGRSPIGGQSSPRSPISPISHSAAGSIRRKLVVIGDGACGKTSMLISYTTGSAPIMYVPTVFENYVASIQVDNHQVEMSLWDTAGQEDYDRLRPLSYPETDVILICFAVDMPNSLTSVTTKWIDEVVQYCEGVPRILVGCKSDLRKMTGDTTVELVTRSKAEEVAEKIQAYKYLECSAKTGEGLAQVFEHAARASLVARRKKRGSGRKVSSKGLPLVSGRASAKKAKKSSCLII